MKNETVDRRVRKTKKNIRDALTELMREKGVKDITVRELSELADINRGTFYNHYKDVFDLLEQIESEMFEEFSGAISSYTPQDVVEQPGIILSHIFFFLEENSQICLSLLGKNGDIAFVDRLKDLVKYKFLNELEGDGIFGPNKDYFFSFTISGFVGMIQYWLETGLKKSPQEMATLSKNMLEYYSNYVRK